MWAIDLLAGALAYAATVPEIALLPHDGRERPWSRAFRDLNPLREMVVSVARRVKTRQWGESPKTVGHANGRYRLRRILAYHCGSCKS
jgi:hypothetical protein